MYVGLSEEVSYLPDFGTMVCKDGPFYVVIAFCPITLFGIRLCFCLYLFLQSRYDKPTYISPTKAQTQYNKELDLGQRTQCKTKTQAGYTTQHAKPVKSHT